MKLLSLHAANSKIHNNNDYLFIIPTIKFKIFFFLNPCSGCRKKYHRPVDLRNKSEKIPTKRFFFFFLVVTIKGFMKPYE